MTCKSLPAEANIDDATLSATETAAMDIPADSDPEKNRTSSLRSSELGPVAKLIPEAPKLLAKVAFLRRAAWLQNLSRRFLSQLLG